jgi:hypothetical protein
MPTGQSSRARRLVELTRSRQLLRRVLVLWGDEVLATVISRHSTVPPVVEDSGGMPPAIVVSFRQWAAKLSQPSVALLVEDDHIIIQQESELIASGSLAGESFRRRTW